ncbi:hypothetical protein GGI09_006837, partial [Coemansia sp. S100]
MKSISLSLQPLVLSSNSLLLALSDSPTSGLITSAGSDSDNGASASANPASATYFEDPYDYDFDIDPKSAAGIRQAVIFIPGAANSANASRSSSVSGSKATSHSSRSNQNSRFNPLSTSNRGSRTTRHSGSDEASLIRGLGIGMFNNLGSGRIIRGVSQEVAKIDSEEDDGSDDDSDTLSIIPAPDTRPVSCSKPDYDFIHRF